MHHNVVVLTCKYINIKKPAKNEKLVILAKSFKNRENAKPQDKKTSG
jgi:hypothetical protein